MQTNFSLNNSKKILHGETLVCVCSDTRYARPVLAKLEKLESEEGTEVALAVLKYIMTNDLRGHLREPNKSDYASGPTAVEPFSKHGSKIVCANCHQMFFDLNGRVKSCPSCKSPVSA